MKKIFRIIAAEIVVTGLLGLSVFLSALSAGATLWDALSNASGLFIGLQGAFVLLATPRPVLGKFGEEPLEVDHLPRLTFIHRSLLLLGVLFLAGYYILLSLYPLAAGTHEGTVQVYTWVDHLAPDWLESTMVLLVLVLSLLLLARKYHLGVSADTVVCGPDKKLYYAGGLLRLKSYQYAEVLPLGMKTSVSIRGLEFTEVLALNPELAIPTDLVFEAHVSLKSFLSEKPEAWDTVSWEDIPNQIREYILHQGFTSMRELRKFQQSKGFMGSVSLSGVVVTWEASSNITMTHSYRW